MVERTTAAPARATTLAVIVTCGVTPYLEETLGAVARQRHHPGVVVLVDVAAPGRDIGTGEPLLEVVHRSGLEDVTRVRLVTAPEAENFGRAVSAGLVAYGRLVERAARRAGRREGAAGAPATGSSFRAATGEISPVTTGEIRAVRDGALDPAAASHPDWLWLLHDDSAPAPQALDRQLRAAEAGRSLAVVGAKQVDWDEPDRLLQVGVRATRRARRVPDVEPREIDQGQHDHRQDVLAVGMAGMLVGSTVWESMAGTDPTLGPFGDGLELCRRIRAAGYRVVVEPTAHVRHRRAAYLGLRDGGSRGVRVLEGPGHAGAAGTEPPPGRPDDAAGTDPAPTDPGSRAGSPARSFGARRTAQLYNALLAARAWPLLALGYVLLGPLRALWRAFGKDTPLALAEISSVARLVGRLGAVPAARRRIAAVSRGSRAGLRELEASPGDVRSARAAIRRQVATSRRLAEAPSELELAERAELGRRRRLTLGLVLVVVLTLALPFVLPLVGGGQPVGGALAHLGRSAGELWTSARSTWLDAGVGAPGPADPLLTLAAGAAWLLDLVGLSPGWVATLAVLLAVPAAALTAWAAAGAATRTLLLRAAAALTWAMSPVLWLSLGQGRLGAVLAHVALPLVALGVAWIAGVRRRDVIRPGLADAARVDGPDADRPTGTDPDRPIGSGGAGAGSALSRTRRPTRAGAITGAAGAALALALASAGAPILLPAAVVGLVLLAPLVPRRRGLLVLVPLPAVVLLAPTIATALARGPLEIAVADPGHGLARAPGPTWLALLGLPQDLAGGAPDSVLDVPSLPWRDLLVLAAGAVLVLLALLALARPARVRAVRAGWILVAVGVATAAAAAHLDGGLAHGVGTTIWPGAGVSLVLLGLLLAVVAGGDALPEALRAREAGWRQGVAAVGAVAVVAVPLVSAASWVLAGSSWSLLEPRAGSAVPALSVEQQASGLRSRVLHLEAGDGEVAAELWRGDGRREADSAATLRLGDAHAPAHADLAESVALLTSGSRPLAVERLARHAVGVVVVDPEPLPGASAADRDALVGRLASVPGLELVTDDETGTVLRLSRDPQVEGSATSIARARLVDADQLEEGAPDTDPGTDAEADDGAGTVEHEAVTDVEAGALDVDTTVTAEDADRVLLLAESADDGWSATLDGTALTVVDHGWQQAFAVPAGASGELEVRHSEPWSRWTGVAHGVVLGAMFLLALPLRVRREEEW